MDAQEAREFATKHLSVWNSHDLDAIVDLYSDEIELHSPLASRLVGPPGIVRGKAQLREYFATGLAAYPDLRFVLLDALYGVDSITVYFRSIEDQRVAEVLVLDARKKVRRVFAHYAK